MAVIALVFVVITAFTAIAFTLSKKAMFDAQSEAEHLRREVQQAHDALREKEREAADLRAELQQQQEQFRKAGYRNLREIPNRIEWMDAALTKQVLENTGWAEHAADLPMYDEWQQLKQVSPEQIQHLTESEQQLADLQQKVRRYTDVLATAGYADITEIPPKAEWETSQLRLKSYQSLLEEAGFQGNIDTLYSFLKQWNKIILEMKRVFKVETNEPQDVLTKLKRLESLQKKVVIPVEQGSIFFGFGQVKIQDQFKQALDTYIEEARRAINAGTYDLIQIEGHTDAIPVRADNPRYRDNWELSAARAHAVAQYFIQQGIPPEHLAVVGHGQYKPKVPGDSEAALAQNRRIEIVFLNTSLLNLGIEE